MISEILSNKYADMVSREDTDYLVFSLLGTEKITEIARRTGLTRRTLYTLKDRKFIQSRTKRKILKASLEISRNYTVDFLLRRSKDQTSNILMIYMSQLYSEALEKNNVKEFKKSLSLFLDVRMKNYGLILDELENEIDTMLRFLEETAEEKFGLDLPPEPLKTANQQHLIETVPYLINSLYLGEETPNNLAKAYNVPIDFSQAISSAIGNISFFDSRIMEPEDPETLNVAGAFISKKFESKRRIISIQSLPAGTSD